MAASLRASESGLEIVDRARRKKGLEKQASSWCGDAQTSVATLKRFWRRKPIEQPVFVNICKAVELDNWEDLVDNSPLSQTDSRTEFFACDDAWVGRKDLISELAQKVQGSCRLLILLGIAGIGKTALAERLAVELQDDDRKFHQENFENQQQASDFASVAIRWLEKWGERITPDDRKDTQRLLNQLVKRLRSNRYLVVIDSLELILKGNEETGWNGFQDQWWAKFFESVLAVESCQSLIIVTSQDLPEQIPARYKNFWYCQELRGLTASEQLALFDQTGLEVEIDSPNKPYLERIGAAYEGHPLALRVIAGEIGSQPFYGNVAGYWHKYGHEIEEVEKAIEEAKTKGITASADDNWRLDRSTRELRKNVRFRLEKTFERLKNDVLNAYRLLCEASVYRCAVPEEFWLSHLEDWDCDDQKQELALDALRDRFLYDQAISYYKESLSKMLKIGYSLGVGKVHGSMGNTYLAIREYERAISCYEKCLVISRETNNQETIGSILGNLGNIYFALGKYDIAIDYAEQHFIIAEKIGNLQGIGIALTNWGNALFKLGHHLEAHKKFLRASEIFIQIGDLRSEALIFYNLASFQADLGNLPLAIESCNLALSISTELGIPLAKECQELKEKLVREQT